MMNVLLMTPPIKHFGNPLHDAKNKGSLHAPPSPSSRTDRLRRRHHTRSFDHDDEVAVAVAVAIAVGIDIACEASTKLGECI